MNIIEAWKAAKDGEEISNGIVTLVVLKSATGAMNFHEVVNNWEVVKKKERRVIAMTMGEVREGTQGYAFQYHVPDSAKVTIEWTE